MTDSTTPGDDPGAFEDLVAELLLADAIASPEPGTGDQQTQPDMGDHVTQPATAPPAPAPVPAPPATPPAPPPGPAGPQFTAPPPAAPATPPAPAAPAPGNAVDPVTGEDLGYPDATQLSQMTGDQQVAYWKHKARKHEQRVESMRDYDKLRETAQAYEKLVAASQTDHERAIAEARSAARAEALAEAGGQLVEQWVRAAAAAVGRFTQESVNALLENLDRSRFLTPNGAVDTDRVYAFVGSIAPAPAAPAAPAAAPTGQMPQPGQPATVTAPAVAAPPRGPDFGQGNPGTPKPNGLAAGREIARQRFGAPSTTAPAQ
jgi:hypothetical protein